MAIWFTTIWHGEKTDSNQLSIRTTASSAPYRKFRIQNCDGTRLTGAELIICSRSTSVTHTKLFKKHDHIEIWSIAKNMFMQEPVYKKMHSISKSRFGFRSGGQWIRRAPGTDTPSLPAAPPTEPMTTTTTPIRLLTLTHPPQSSLAILSATDRPRTAVRTRTPTTHILLAIKESDRSVGNPQSRLSRYNNYRARVQDVAQEMEGNYATANSWFDGLTLLCLAAA